ncbi:Na+/H+ antiporter subunit E [Sandaracinobacter sp. RS1-74]|uniref:Na+/H+ antiporter subunit E n=1 Tax=Sandaracinobacteroides sayramensis TaxID=2913411 RepID=UPI001EDC6D66|nr:Na+/H+ antiporter subunit E [Sandaracinobacteroides sayramensis]MCG2839714.1 Na+/H+ antiporter subunit E [Sandaracinobacteroides sayramensis]
MMKRILPYPLFGLALLVMWLLLMQSISPGQILLGCLVALIATNAMSALQPETANIRFGMAMLRLPLVVLQDIFRSNLAVGRIILQGQRQHIRSGFLQIPLDMRDRFGLGVLAIILTATPGTLWVQYDRSRNLLLLHVLDFVDPDHWVELIKERYERLLMEIFE